MKKRTRLMYALLMILIMAACLLPAQKTLADGPQAEDTTISNVEIAGFKTPKAGEIPQKEGFSIKPEDAFNIVASWTPDASLENGQFKGGCSYTLLLTLRPKAGYIFSDSFDISRCTIYGINENQINKSYLNQQSLEISIEFTTEKVPITYNVYFNAGGGSGKMDSVSLEENTRYTLPKCTFTAPNGKIFDKWDKGAPGEKITVDSNMTIKALWKSKSVISFDAGKGSGSMDSVTVPSGTEYTLPKCTFTAPDGMEFDSWKQGAVGQKITITADTTLIAQWKKMPVISFDPNGGTESMKSVAVPSGTEYTLPKCIFNAPDGMEFDSWKQGAVGQKITITADTTLIAQWKKLPVISFDAGDGSGSMDSVAVPYGTQYTLPDCAFTAPDGMVFDQWNQGAVGKTITITDNTTIKAIWKQPDVVISFDAGDGSGSMDSVAVPYGTEYTLPNCTFTAPNNRMVFYRWDQGEPGDTITIKADTTLTALWKQLAIITFNPGEGSGKKYSVTVPVDTEYTLPNCTFTAPNRMIFDKWDKGKPGDKIKILSSIVITAKWKTKDPNDVVISFDSNGGKGSMNIVALPKGTKYVLPKCSFSPPDQLSTFDKWDQGAPGEKITVTANMTIKALWKDIFNNNAKPGDRLKNAGGIEGQEVLIITPSQVSYTQAPAKSVVTIPSTIKSNGRTYKVTSVEKNAFSRTKARTVIVGKNVKKLKKGAFANSKVKKIILKTKLLRKKTVKGSLKKSKVKTIKVKVGKKKINKKYVKKYKKIFKKKYSGKKAKVTK